MKRTKINCILLSLFSIFSCGHHGFTTDFGDNSKKGTESTDSNNNGVNDAENMDEECNSSNVIELDCRGKTGNSAFSNQYSFF